MDNKNFIIAVSGGPDSMSLLDLLKNKIVAVCHVNYKKRVDSYLDQKIVEDYCNLHNIKLYVKEVEYSDNDKNENFQSLARKIRYDFFSEVAKIENCFNLLVAHNKNDFLETAYMQVSKKSKSLFYGIKFKSFYRDLTIYRPLIRISKNTLEKYCILNSINYAIDSSNLFQVYSRNKIRKTILDTSNNKLNKFIYKINEYNNKNKEFSLKIEKLYSEWNNNYLFYKKLSNDEKYYLIYKFLVNNEIKVSSKKKMENILLFLDHKRGKKFILEKNNFIFIKNNKILVEY